MNQELAKPGQNGTPASGGETAEQHADTDTARTMSKTPRSTIVITVLITLAIASLVALVVWPTGEHVTFALSRLGLLFWWLLEIFTHGWPLATVAIAFLVRRQLVALFSRIEKLTGRGGGVEITAEMKKEIVASAQGAGSLPGGVTAPALPVPTPSPASTAPSASTSAARVTSSREAPTAISTSATGAASSIGAAPKPASSANAQTPTTTVRASAEQAQWQLAGNIYWLAHNIMITALFLLLGDVPKAVAELSNAISHAREVGVSPIYIKALEDQRVFNFADPNVRQAVASALTHFAVQIGYEMAARQADFEQRDVPARRTP